MGRRVPSDRADRMTLWILLAATHALIAYELAVRGFSRPAPILFLAAMALFLTDDLRRKKADEVDRGSAP